MRGHSDHAMDMYFTLSLSRHWSHDYKSNHMNNHMTDHMTSCMLDHMTIYMIDRILVTSNHIPK